MLGAIVGDIIGSVHEFSGTKTKDFPLFVTLSTFTDDTVLTVAVADWIMSGRNLTDILHEYTQAYPGRGYGGMYGQWARNRLREPYNSFGNGAAMRASPVGFAFAAMEEVLGWAERSAAVTHNHPEGIRGAQATAAAVFLARMGKGKKQIRGEIESRFGYDLGRKLDQIRPSYKFNETCQGTVPEALIAFLESIDYEDAVRNAISLGGDADTLACITGGVAEAFYGGVPDDLVQQAASRLDGQLAATVQQFRKQFALSTNRG
ncbi:MAG TPA: ADP-ribosylglycohydrolase family protein [Terriglobia bacterium]|nr:ADP-ribosylglycohydrolase family protein [Terriglobia bacterium]